MLGLLLFYMPYKQGSTMNYQVLAFVLSFLSFLSLGFLSVFSSMLILLIHVPCLGDAPIPIVKQNAAAGGDGNNCQARGYIRNLAKG